MFWTEPVEIIVGESCFIVVLPQNLLDTLTPGIEDKQLTPSVKNMKMIKHLQI